MGFFRQRAKGYRAAVRVEKYRAAAVQLRENEPELYAQALAQANGSDAEAAAKRDPDAYVALFLAAFEDEKQRNPTALVDDGAPVASDLDYWPRLDADAVLGRVGQFFGSIQEEKGAPQYYPNWVVRRHIAFEVIQAAASVDPEVLSDGEALFADADDPKDFFFEENPRLDDELERYLARQHLTQIVDAIMGALTDDS